MTSAGGAPAGSAPPGWYPDPDGAPGTARWWDGGAWSDVTTPAGPGVQLQAPALPQPPDPAPQSPAGPATGRRGLLLGLAVLALVVVVAVAVAVTGPGGAQPSAAPRTGALPPAGSTFAPGTVSIVDRDAGISYPYLGNGWYEFDLATQAETTATAGQYFTTQERVPDGGEFIAQCTSGPLTDRFGYTGPGSLASATASVQAFVRAAHYPRPNQQEIRRDEDLLVDGRPAHVIEWELKWHVPGYDATGERAAVLLVDVGRPAPALLYVSIPNTHAELYGVIDRVIDAVEVL